MQLATSQAGTYSEGEVLSLQARGTVNTHQGRYHHGAKLERSPCLAGDEVLVGFENVIPNARVAASPHNHCYALLP